MKKYIVENVVKYQPTVLAAFDTKEKAVSFVDANKLTGVVVLAEIEVDPDGNPTGDERHVLKVW